MENATTPVRTNRGARVLSGPFTEPPQVNVAEAERWACLAGGGALAFLAV